MEKKSPHFKLHLIAAHIILNKNRPLSPRNRNIQRRGERNPHTHRPVKPAVKIYGYIRFLRAKNTRNIKRNSVETKAAAQGERIQKRL
jgi:hypothetical protein